MAKKSPAKTEEKLEREYVIPLRKKTKIAVRYKKTPKAIKTIKEFLVRHMKIRDRDLSKIKIDKSLNEIVWFRGIKKPPARIKVRAVKEGEIVRVYAVEAPERIKFKELREEKREKKAVETASKKKLPVKTEEKQTEQEKKEEKEKVKAGAEISKQIEKAAAKQTKQQVGGKTKQPKRQIRKALAK
ncbi:MAG: 50S ribosomal protein L31e [Nanoarchaeota archaeon]|nr:50S ribosomal protein L31e [Nanoarchaeota archaeon]